MAEILDLIFSHSFQGKIWKMLIDGDGKHLAIELRSDTSLQVQFLYLDLGSNQLFEIEIDDADWWTSLSGVDKGHIELKRYESEGNPSLKETMLWDVLDHKQIITDKVHSKNEIEPNTAAITFYPKSNDHFNTLNQFINQLIPNKVLKAGIEYAEYDNGVVLSYYTGESKLANYLLVVNKERRVLLHDCLADNLTGIGQETFTVSNNKLIFVKNKRELNIYQLI